MNSTHRLRRFLARLIIALASTGAAIVSPATASAETVTHKDAQHDVGRSSLASDDPHPAPKNKNTDIVRTRIRYSKHVVVLRVKTRRALPKKSFAIYSSIKTPAARYEVDVVRMFGMSSKELRNVTDDYATVDCDGLRVRRHGRVVRLAVPATCLGDPSWVQAGIGTITKTKHRYFFDDALTRKLDDERVHLSRRVHRG